MIEPMKEVQHDPSQEGDGTVVNDLLPPAPPPVEPDPANGPAGAESGLLDSSEPKPGDTADTQSGME